MTPLTRSELAAQLLALVESMSDESTYHLATALGAAQLAGVGGNLVINIPKRVGEHAKVQWVGGSQGLSLPL